MQGNKKFFFDLNNFDEPDGPTEEELIPTFSEEELEAAKQAGYELGKADGIAQEKASREQQVAALVGQIRQSYQTLVTSETLREQIYEEEALRLMHVALKTLFPTLNARLGLQEMEAMIERVIQTQKNQTKIIIKVPADVRDDVEAALKAGSSEDTQEEKYLVQADHSLIEGSCAIEWEDGGAVRNSQKLIDTMILEVDRLLPEQTSHSPEPQKDDINKDKSENDQDSDNSDQSGETE